jgi:hypothetical protein
MVTVLRPLSTSELLDRRFHLYRNHFIVFLAIAAIPQLIVLAVQLFIAGTLLGNTPKPLGMFSLLVSLASLICIQLSGAATVFAVSNLHLDRPVKIGAAFQAVGGSVLRVIWVSFVVSLVTGFAFVLLIVPGVYCALAYSLAIPVTVLEGTHVGDTMRRSSDLTKGTRGRIFVTYGLLTIVSLVVSSCIDFAIGLGSPLHIPVTFTAAKFALSAVSDFVVSSLVSPLLTIAFTLIYYDQRVRKEGFDLQLMMSTLEGGAPNASLAPAS